MKYVLIIALILTKSFSLISQMNYPLDDIANQYLKKYKVPGLAICVIKPDTTLYGVAGTKRIGKNQKISIRDKFHIGSNAKAITTTIGAMLIEKGVLQWNTKLLDLVPELRTQIRKEFLELTFSDLMSNRALIPPFEDDSSKEWKGLLNLSNTVLSKYEFAKYVFSLKPVISENEKGYSYSNAGFIIAALMMERATNQTWEDLLMNFNKNYNVNCSIGFPNQVDGNGTFGHKKGFSKYKPVNPQDEYKFPFEFSPAGNMSISILELSTFVKSHLLGLHGENNVLKSKTYQKLHFGLKGYSYGWYNGNIGDTEQMFSYHGGSIGTFSSAIMLSADREVGIIILVNSDDKKTNQLKEEIRTELWEKYRN